MANDGESNVMRRALASMLALAMVACGEDRRPTAHEVDPPCGETNELEDLLCGSPVVALVAPRAEGTQRVVAGDANGRVYELERDGGASFAIVESRVLNGPFHPLKPILACDVDRNGIDELILFTEGNASGTLLWDGRLLDEHETRVARIPSEELWRVGCADLDGDGAADLWGFPAEGSDLLVYRGTSQGFEEAPIRVPLGEERIGPLLKADVARRPGCGGSALLVLAQGSPTEVGLMNIDIDAREADGIGSLTLAAKLRAVFLQARGDDSAVILAQLVDIEAGNQVSVSVFESAGCSEPFIELATMPFSRVRRVHAVSPRDPAIAEWVIVGDDVEGVVLLAVEDGIAEVVRRWDVAAIDAVLMVPEAGGERAAVIAVPEPPFLRWEPL